MTRSEILGLIANSNDDELGDMLLECAVEWWLENGADRDEVLFLTETVLDERDSPDAGS